MKFDIKKRNTPIATLIKDYINKNSGKVSDSRNEIQRRFDYLDWKDQKKIMQAFLESGKTDRLWAYSKLVDNWDKSFEPRIKELWEQLHEDKCSWVVTRHFPTKYLSQNIDKFTDDRDYYFICLRLAEDKNYIIDRSKLSVTDYLSVLYHTDRPFSDDEARNLLYKTVYDVCTEDSYYTQLSRYATVGKDAIISPILFQSVNLAVYYLRQMDLIDVVRQFETWNEGVQRTVFNSQEYKTVLTADLLEYDLREAKAKIAKKYAYLALDDKYKETEDFNVDSILTPREWFKENKIREGIKMPSKPDYSEPTDPTALKELIAENPAVKKLVGDLGLDINAENDLPF